MSKFVLLFFSIVFIVSVIFFVLQPRSSQLTPVTILREPTIQMPSPTPTEIPIDHSFMNDDVPFTVQAPLGEWSDPLQQDACEEAAIMMAIKWARNETITSPQSAKDEILDIANYQQERFGESRDTSASDSLERIARGYYNFTTATLGEIISSDDIIRELYKGNLVITPMNGQAMNNPHFTAPGPERHMVLIIGYDHTTNEFITNDAGIAPGKNYRYPVDVFYNAIRDYETGYHIPIEGTKKNMLVIQK